MITKPQVRGDHGILALRSDHAPFTPFTFLLKTAGQGDHASNHGIHAPTVHDLPLSLIERGGGDIRERGGGVAA